MKIKYSSNLLPAQDFMQKIAAVAWSPNGKKLAVATSQKTVLLFDDQGERKDRFTTKASEKAQKLYVIKGLEFSPCSQMIAVAQSDNIVFVYKIGVQFGQKKAICKKYLQSSQVTCMTWPKESPNELYVGLAEGKVKAQSFKSKASKVLYSTNSFVISLTSSRDSECVISGHIDGSVYVYNISSESSRKLFTHHSVPYALGIGEHIVAAGNDNKVSFYDRQGNIVSRFDYTSDDRIKDFTIAAMHPSGDTVVLGNFNRYFVYNFNSKLMNWEEVMSKEIPNYYSITAGSWKNDGSKLVLGSLCGSLDIYSASYKKLRLRGKFQMNYVSPSQIIVQTLGSGRKMVVRSQNNLEISKVQVQKDRYFVGHTYSSLIVGDLQTNKVSEIPWKRFGQEQLIFSNPGICMVFTGGELSIVEYGSNEIIGTCRTEHIKKRMISVRAVDKKTRLIAYLLDLMTICIQDLNSNSMICQISHDTKIEYLELNPRGTKLLFKDKRKQLYIYSLKDHSRTTLLPYCSFVQWVPSSEVVIAQNRGSLFVWYSIENVDKVTTYPIKGEAESVARSGGKTEVIVSDGTTTNSYALDENLIEFGFAVEARDLEKAASILDTADLTPQTQSNWKNLASIAVETQNLYVAEHCYSALGDIAKASYLRKLNKMIKKHEEETGSKDGINFYKVQAKIAVLEKQFSKAQAILLQHNEVEEAMEMYQELHKWGESIKIAELKKHPDVAELKSNYFTWLIETRQEQKAAEVKESQRNYTEAVKLYLKGGLPAKAAAVVINNDQQFSKDLLEKIASSLASAGMFEKAGEFYEEMEMNQKSLECYCKGNSFKKAVDLARRVDPSVVYNLEDRWGDYLVSVRQTENAINHYVEGRQVKKAIDAAIDSRQWNKAIQLLSSQPPETSRPYYSKIASYYASMRQYDFAEKYYLEARVPVQAFEMYAKVSKWDQALRVSRDYLPEDERMALYIKQGQSFEKEGKYKEAEKMYLTVDDVEMAIAMYKRAEQYENMVRLVAKHRPKFLKETHLTIAQKLQEKNNLKDAEQHYIDGGAWHMAVNMYRTKNNWEDAIRTCKMYGNDKQTCELAKKWLQVLGPEQGMKMLMKMNLVDAVVEHLCDRKEFDEAFRIANAHAKHKLRDAHLKKAFYLEDQKQFKEAEENFIRAGKPDEAISMYEHMGDFHSALQVAKEHLPAMLPSIFLSQAKYFIEKREFAKAQNCYINAKKPELAIKMYKDSGMKADAIRLQKKFPHINIVFEDPSDVLQQAKAFDSSKDYSRALDSYLEVKPDYSEDQEILVQAWERAIQIAIHFDKSRVVDTTKIVAKRLKDLGRHELSGSHLENVGLFEEATHVFIEGKLFSRAEETCSQISDRAVQDKLRQLINDRKKAKAITDNDTGKLIESGETETALRMMATNGDWDNCLMLAQRSGPEHLNRFLSAYVRQSMEAQKFGQAALAYNKYGMPLIQQSFPLYKKLTEQILVECDPKEIAAIRGALYNFVKLLEGTSEGSSPLLKDFQKMLLIAHLANLRAQLQSKGPNAVPLLMRVSVGLLRYCDLIRLDKLYLDAGTACQKANQLPMAVKFLNRYLDINELIEDPDNNNLGENGDFDITDIPRPQDVPFPEKNLIPGSEKEKIKDWLLQVAMNKKVNDSLPTRPCDKCGTNIFAAALSCFKCKTKYDACILSGYPALSSASAKCKTCGKPGLKENWTVYLQFYANCPWCNSIPN